MKYEAIIGGTQNIESRYGYGMLSNDIYKIAF
jgi:hypothetical protein